MSRLRHCKVASALALACAAAGAQAAAVSATASVIGSTSQTVTTSVAGQLAEAAGFSAISSLDGCTPVATQDNRALGFASARADYGQLRIFGSTEGDAAYLRHNGPTVGGVCNMSITGLVTTANAGARFSDELTVSSLSGAIGTTIDLLVRGYWDASLSTNGAFKGLNLTASLSIAGTSVVSDTAATAIRTVVDADTTSLGRTFERLITVTVGDLFSLTSQFSVGLTGSGLSCGAAPSDTCDQTVVFDGRSTAQITEFVLPSGYVLSAASGQIANYGDHFAYLAVGGAPSGGGSVPAPATAWLAMAGLAAAAARWRPAAA